MRFCLFCGIASASDRHPGGLTPITNRVGRKVPGVRGKLLDAHYDGASSPTAVAAGSIAAARAEPQNRQRVLLRYQRLCAITRLGSIHAGRQTHATILSPRPGRKLTGADPLSNTLHSTSEHRTVEWPTRLSQSAAAETCPRMRRRFWQ